MFLSFCHQGLLKFNTISILVYSCKFVERISAHSQRAVHRSQLLYDRVVVCRLCPSPQLVCSTNITDNCTCFDSCPILMFSTYKESRLSHYMKQVKKHNVLPVQLLCLLWEFVIQLNGFCLSPFKLGVVQLKEKKTLQ